MKNNKSIIVLSLIGIFCIIGLTLAYFSNSTTIKNEFETEEYGTTVKEEFVSPSNWTPGAISQKRVYVTNTGESDVAVRISYTEKWTTVNGENLDLTFTKDGEEISAAIITFGDNFQTNWIKSTENGVDYYYYKEILSSEGNTTDFIKEIKYNNEVTSTSTCREENVYDDTTGELIGIESKCESGNGYDGATYTLTLKIETVQASVYKQAWNTEHEIGL